MSPKHFLFIIAFLAMPISSSFIFVEKAEAALDGAGSGLVGWWKFDEGSGTTAADSSGNGNTGMLTGGSWSLGKIGAGSVSFDGDDHISIPAPSDSPLNFRDDFTISFWVNPINTNTNVRWIEKGWNNSFKIGRSSSGGGSSSIDFYVNGSRVYGGSYVSGQWTHIAAVYTRSTQYAKLFKDGAVIAEGAVGVPAGNSNNISLGKHFSSAANYFNGSMDEVRMYARALSDAEIQELYDADDSPAVEEPDTAAPSISMTGPMAGSVISGTVSISATASDNTSVSHVQFMIDGNDVGISDMNSPYSVLWDSSQVSDGVHAISAEATDLAGNFASSQPVMVTIANSIPVVDPTPIATPSATDSCSNKIQDGGEDGVDCGGGCKCACPSNWKSGISVLFNGTPEVDYAEEYLYHDKLIDDHKVVYIRSGTPIVMEHNDRNIITPVNMQVVGKNGADNIANSGDEGIIRFKIDRDLQYRWAYGGNATNNFGALPPAYSGPFSLSSQEYEPGIPVVGTVGSNGLSVADKTNYYFRGMRDSFGDEWHTFSYWDDDTGIVSGTESGTEHWASDGKIIQFVVNPKTPLLSFESTSSGQFYTTPPKTYFVPVIHDQTTYLTDNVQLKLVNIMSNATIYYRFDSSPFQAYAGPISSNSLSDGDHVLEYYYDNSYHKTRKIVKDPGFPSDQDRFADGTGHGYLLWKNDQDYSKLRQRLLTGPLSADYISKRDSNSATNGNGHSVIDQSFRSGRRTGPAFALINAIVVAVEGASSRPSHAAHAKRALMDNVLSLDILGSERWGPFQPLPHREKEYRGYYDVNSMFDAAFAYDLLIKHFRSDQFSGGITPIEDYKIRDLLAMWIHESMLWMGGYSLEQPTSPTTEPVNGMWDTAKMTGSIVAAMSMPGYDSAYYGTSGFDGKAASHLNAPYPNYPASWKDVFVTNTNNQNAGHVAKIYGYPNQRKMFNPFDGGLITNRNVPVNWTLTDGTAIAEIPAGNFSDRRGYYNYPLMGHVFHIIANTVKRRLNLTYPYLELSFRHSNDGQLYGLKTNNDADRDPMHAWQYLLVNEYFAEIAPGAEAYLPLSPEQRFQYLTHPFGLVWYNKEWSSQLSGPDTTPQPDAIYPAISIVVPSGGSIVSGSVNISASASDNIGVVGVQFRLDGSNLGTELTTAPYSGTWNTVGVANGTHTLAAVARDAAGNTRTSSQITITVTNTVTPPVVTPISTPVISPSGGGGGSLGGNSGAPSGGSSPSPLGTFTPTVTQPISVAPVPSVNAFSGLSFTRYLVVGSVGEDVKRLQQTLNSLGYTISSQGAGSPGNETIHYGPATTLAIQKFQCAVLKICSGSPFTNGYGNFGPATRSALNSRMSGVSTFSTTTPVIAAPVSTTSRLPKTFRFIGALKPFTTNANVKNLQIFLNDNGFLVSASGPGSKGFESTYFGNATKAALIRFQEYHASEILVPNGLTKGTGNFGVSTMKKVNEVLGK